MTVVPVASTLIDEDDSAIRLAWYAQRVGYPECAFWGVYSQGDEQNQCYPIKGLAERKRIAFYLKEAQDEIEQVTGYPLSPRWFANEQHPFACTLHTLYGKVIEVGIRATTDIALNSPVDHTTDPAIVGPIATTVTDPDEIHVYHPDEVCGQAIEIDPSCITISGGFVTIEIPRCRLVIDPDNPAEGWDYTDVGNCSASVPVPGVFECSVDIRRVYNDPDTQATLVWPHRSSAACTCDCGCDNCSEYTETACAYVRNGDTGALDVRPATESGGVWTAHCSTCYCSAPELVRVNYRAGLTTLTKQAEDAIIRLAHSKMPKPPCGCGELMEMWTRDRNVPQVLDSKRLDCEFGISDGAWQAWKFANAMKLYRAGII